MLLLLLRHAAPSSPCFTVPPDAPAQLDLTNSSHECAELDWGLFQQQTRLQLSHNGIGALSPSSRVKPGLEELDLSHNRLRELPAAFLSPARGLRHLQLQHNQLRQLPADFFANATALQSLRLEGNPLPAVPRTAFQASLRFLAVACRCDVVGSVLERCACSQPNCTAPQCRCLTPHRDFNAPDFYAQECWSNVGLVAGMAGAASVVAVLLLVAAVLCYRRRKAAASVATVGWGKRESTAAPRQPRYISRAAEIGTTEAAASPDYENVFMSPCIAPAAAQGWTPGWQEKQYSPQVPADDNYFLEVEAVGRDQPIYANTQYHGEDSVYVVPDQ
ncbi:leucine-rich repeat-containing protein 25 [Pelecanus crispus]|uniref:leucine-rich repeat-containing protein 25 n=1 Tax=Pelecanus crispus TaxID=36300 RepID=UPI003F5D37CD